MRPHRLAVTTTAITALTIGLAVTPATAGIPNNPTATTYTVTGGPDADFVGSGITLTDVDSSILPPLTCLTFDLIGTVTNSGASRAYGAEAGSLGSLNASGCVGLVPVGAWKVAITGYVDGANWQARLSGIEVNVTAPGCSFPLGAGTATDYVSGTFNDSTQVFTPNPGAGPNASTLTISATPAGPNCTLYGVAQGDRASVAGTWTNTPPTGSTPLTITNP